MSLWHWVLCELGSRWAGVARLLAPERIPARGRAWFYLAVGLCYAAVIASAVPLQALLVYAIPLAGAVLAWPDLKPYLAALPWGRAVRLSLVLFVLHKCLGAFGTWLQGTPDPQELTTWSLTPAKLVLGLAETPLVAVSEELFKALLGLALLALLPRMALQLRVVAASAVVAAVFGFLHVTGGWPLSAGLPLAFWALPDFAVMVYARSLWPLVAAHALNNGIAYLVIFFGG